MVSIRPAALFTLKEGDELGKFFTNDNCLRNRARCDGRDSRVRPFHRREVLRNSSRRIQRWIWKAPLGIQKGRHRLSTKPYTAGRLRQDGWREPRRAEDRRAL